MLLVIKEAAEKSIKTKENKEKQNEGDSKEEVSGKEKGKKANKGKDKQVVSEVSNGANAVAEGKEAIALWNKLPQALQQAAMCFGKDSTGKGKVNGVTMTMWIKVYPHTQLVAAIVTV